MFEKYSSSDDFAKHCMMKKKRGVNQMLLDPCTNMVSHNKRGLSDAPRPVFSYGIA